MWRGADIGRPIGGLSANGTGWISHAKLNIAKLAFKLYVQLRGEGCFIAHVYLKFKGSIFIEIFHFFYWNFYLNLNSGDVLLKFLKKISVGQIKTLNIEILMIDLEI